MTALRTLYCDMPQTIIVSIELRHRVVEVIMLLIDEEKTVTSDFKSWLQDMPEIDEEFFARSQDMNKI